MENQSIRLKPMDATRHSKARRRRAGRAPTLCGKDLFFLYTMLNPCHLYCKIVTNNTKQMSNSSTSTGASLRKGPIGRDPKAETYADVVKTEAMPHPDHLAPSCSLTEDVRPGPPTDNLGAKGHTS